MGIIQHIQGLGSYDLVHAYQRLRNRSLHPRMNNAALTGMAARRHVHTLEQRAAQQNMENAISYLRTADGWLQTIHNMMGRMGELAVSATDGTKSPQDRRNLQTEFSQMQRAIQSITSGANPLAQFNGIPLFQGRSLSLGTTSFHSPNLAVTGSGAIGNRGGNAPWGDRIDAIEVRTAQQAAQAGPAIQQAAEQISSIRVEGQAMINRVKADASAMLRGEPAPGAQTPAELASIEEAVQYDHFLHSGEALRTDGVMEVTA
jgi:hypothetical protein